MSEETMCNFYYFVGVRFRRRFPHIVYHGLHVVSDVQAAAAGVTVTDAGDAVNVMHAPAVVIGTVLYRPELLRH